MCSDGNSTNTAEQSNERKQQEDNLITNYTAINTGGWQGGDYQALLEGEGMVSCDSSVGAWSEDGHRDHMEIKKKSRRSRSQQKRKRASSIVHGTLVMQRVDQSKPSHPILSPQHPLTTSTSDEYSASISSPLHNFPKIPARGNSGRLVPPTNIIAPRSFIPAPLQILRNTSSVISQVSQERVDDSPLDVASILASGWALESEDDQSQEEAMALIDSLLSGVQEGFIASNIVESPDELTEDDGEEEGEEENDSQAGWETEDCDITPRLRQKWQYVDLSSSAVSADVTQNSDMSTRQDSSSESSPSINAKISSARRLSFLRVPSAIFPHTPGPVQRQSIVEKRTSTMSTFSTSSQSRKRSEQSRNSSGSTFSLSSSSSKTARRRSIHTAPNPRPTSRKSKYYSRPTLPGFMPALKQQHLKGARGKFWSPMNSMYLEKEDDGVTQEAIKARQSTRFSRRSGQAWVRPRTFESKNQYRVTIYPPQVDDSHKQRAILTIEKDPEKTPTQAQFTTVQAVGEGEPQSNSTKVKPSISWGLPTCPPPMRTLPPVPMLGHPPQQARSRSNRQSRALSMSQYTSTSTTCSQCQQSDFTSCSCSQTYTETVTSDRNSSYLDTFSDSQTCSRSDMDTCSCTTTRSSMAVSQTESMMTPRQFHYGFREGGNLDKASQVLGLPRSAPIFGLSVETTDLDQPHSAPYYSSQHPPVLDPLPRFSPLCINFDRIFGIHRNKSRRRSSTVIGSSRMSCCSCSEVTSTYCSTCSEGSDLSYLRRHSDEETTSCGSLSVSTSPSYASEAKSYSSSSPSMGELDTDSDSDKDSDMPMTPPRSEYQSSYGLSESPGYRMSFIVSPMPQSAKRNSEMQELLLNSPSIHREEEEFRPVSQFTSTTTTMTSTTTTSKDTNSSTGSSRGAPRSILKTSSRYRECSPNVATGNRRPTISMAEDTKYKSASSFNFSSRLTSSTSTTAATAPQRATLATSTLTKSDIEGRIQREENRRIRNESRLYALEKLEGKTKKSSLFLSLLSNASSTGAASVAGGGAKYWQEVDDDSSPLPQTPLTPAKNDLLELQRQLEHRQKITQFQNNKAVSFTDVIGFDMGTYPKIPSRKRFDSSACADEQDAKLKHQLKKLSTAIEARQYAKDKCIDK